VVSIEPKVDRKANRSMENAFSTEDYYPNKFLRGYSILPDDTRIFHRTEYIYGHLAALEQGFFKDGVLSLQSRLASGDPVSGAIEVVHPQALRLKIGPDGARFDPGIPMLAQPLPPLPGRRQFSSQRRRNWSGYIPLLRWACGARRMKTAKARSNPTYAKIKKT
jgi:hypothetical protein